MAFGTSSAKPVFTRYTGIGIAKVVGINPTMKEINDAFGREVYTNEPTYTQEVEYDGVKSKMSRVSFLLKFEASDNMGYSDLHFLTISITNKVIKSSDTTNPKVQVIDEFGRTAWVTEDEFKEKKIPVYSNGPAKLTNNYHAVLRGEERLVKFISAVRATPSIDVWDPDGKCWVTNKREDAENCKKEIPKEDMKKILNGDFSPVRSYLEDVKDNKVKVVLGVQTSNDGRQYNTIYDGDFMTVFQKKTTNIEKSVREAQANGRYPNTVFTFGPLVEATSVKPDDLSKPIDPAISSPSVSAFNPLDDLPFD